MFLTYPADSILLILNNIILADITYCAGILPF
nr:MAG TPA: hypothetical protein [Caudoviricetes sp.]